MAVWFKPQMIFHVFFYFLLESYQMLLEAIIGHCFEINYTEVKPCSCDTLHVPTCTPRAC
jgi:hypothetical protein